MAEAVKEPILIRHRVRLGPKYKETAYRRPLFHRLTPFTWFVIVFIVNAVIVTAIVLANRITPADTKVQMLPQRLQELKLADATSHVMAPAVTAVPAQQAPGNGSTSSGKVVAPLATPTALPLPTDTPTPLPTGNPNDAPWANQLIQQLDGTYLAPQDVTSRCVSDVSAFFEHMRNLTLNDYMHERYNLLNNYFAGQALVTLRQQENNRTQYAVNRSGSIIVQINNFSTDGFTAVASITRKSWINDVYNVKSTQIIQAGVHEPDSLIVMLITYDRTSKQWKFSTLDPDSEVIK